MSICHVFSKLIIVNFFALLNTARLSEHTDKSFFLKSF